MVTPLVHDLSAKRAVCILVPDRHPKTSQDANLEEWGRDVRLGRVRKGKEPGTRSWQTIEAEVSHPMAILNQSVQQMMANLGLDLGGQALLGRRCRRSVDASIGKKSRTKGGLNLGAQEATINVIFIKGRPNRDTKRLGLAKARDVGRRSVLSSAAKTKASIGNSQAGYPPGVVRQPTSYQATKGVTDVHVGLPKALLLKRWRHRSARVKNLGPTTTRTQQCESTLSIRVTANGVQQILRLGDTTLEERFAPSMRPDCSTQKFEIPMWHPQEPSKISWGEILDRCASWDDLSLLTCNVEPNVMETSLKSGEEKLHGRETTSDDTVVEEEGEKIDIAREP